jgi:peptide/nickel transport system substrate-binding protein
MITPATAGFVPKGMPSFNADVVKGYSYNPTEARCLLKDAGYPNGVGLPMLVINTTANYLDICEFIQSELSGIGVRSKIEVNESATHRKIVANQGMDFFRGSWLGDYPDAENYLSLFYSKNFAPGGPNYTHFKSAEYDKLFEEAMRVVDDSARFVLYQQLDKMVVDNAPVMFLYYDRAVRFVNRRVTGFGIDPMNRLVLKKVKK